MTFTKWLNSARPLMGQTDILCLLSCDAAGGTQHHLGINLAKKYLTNSNHEETTRHIQIVKHKTADIYSSKISTPWETKRSWRNCSRLKEKKDYEFNGWSLTASWSVLLRLQCTCESLGDLTNLRALILCVRNGPWESAFLMSSQVTPVLPIHSVKLLGCDYNICTRMSLFLGDADRSIWGWNNRKQNVYADVLICVYGDSGERKQNIDITIDSPGPAR